MDIVKGDIIQHFKHDPKNGKWHIYEVLAIAQPLPREPIGLPFVCEATHTEAGILLKVCQLGERYFVGALPTDWVKPHVIYSNTREAGVWARPLHHFNEPMEDGRSRFSPYKPRHWPQRTRNHRRGHSRTDRFANPSQRFLVRREIVIRNREIVKQERAEKAKRKEKNIL